MPTAAPGDIPGTDVSVVPLALGATITSVDSDPASIDRYAALVGGMPAVVNWYNDWVHAGFYVPDFDAVASRGAVPMLSWTPQDDGKKGLYQPHWSLRAIIAGEHDAYIHQFARDAAAWGRPFYLRLAWEMNANWNLWSEGVNGNKPGEYVAMWRHVHDIFGQEGATNARWVWCPNTSFAGSTPLAGLYPGDDYVDWLGLDGYNDGGDGWQSFAQLFAPSYREITALSGKPLMLAEVGCAPSGGDKAGWLTQTFLVDIPQHYPQIRAVVYFNTVELGADWRVDSSATALLAWQQIVVSPYYRGKVA